MTYLFVLAVLYFIYVHIILAGNDPTAGTKHFVSNIFTIVVPVLTIFVLLSLVLFKTSSVAYFGIGALISIIFIYLIYYFVQTTISQYIFNKYLLYIVIAAIFLFAASIFYTIFSGTLRKLTGWTGFFANLIFYIPCLLRDFVAKLTQEYSTFSNTLVVLFACEVLLIMMYFFMIPFVNSRIFPTNTVLLEDPILLNTGKTLKTPVDISNNFGLSLWTYVNPGSSNKPGYAEESNIFSLLDASGNTHIQLTYSNVEKGNNDFIMYVGEQAFPMSLPLQKWHNFVFNYVTYDAELPDVTSTPGPTTPTPQTSMWQYILSFFYKTPAPTKPHPKVHRTTVDMFVNGALERSFTYDGISAPIPEVKNNSEIFVGNVEETLFMAEDGVEGASTANSNRDGLYGSICNIVYYKEPVTKMALIYNYNLLSIQNPPV